MAVIHEMVAAQEPFERVSVGFPGVVQHGVIKTAPNLGTPQWAGIPLTGRPHRDEWEAGAGAQRRRIAVYGVINAKVSRSS